MAKITLSEQDQALLLLLPQRSAGAVIHKLLGEEVALDHRSARSYEAILNGVIGRERGRNRKRKSRDNAVTVTEMSQVQCCDSHADVTGMSQERSTPLGSPPCSPPSLPPTPPISTPPIIPPTNPPARKARAGASRPEGIRGEAEWEAFVAMRKQIKKPLTPRAVSMALSKLEELAPGDVSMQKKILDQSTYHCWQSLFALDGAGDTVPAKPKKYKTVLVDGEEVSVPDE